MWDIVKDMFGPKRKIAVGFDDLAKDPTVQFNKEGDPFFSVGKANVVLFLDPAGGMLVAAVRPAQGQVISDSERMRIAKHMEATLRGKNYWCEAYKGGRSGYGSDSIVVGTFRVGEKRNLLENYRDVKEAAEKADALVKKFESAGLSSSTGRG